MHNHVSNLVQWIDSEVALRDPDFLDKWVSSLNSRSTSLDKFAVELSKSYLGRKTSFDEANGLLNKIMPIVGFDEAPKIFWQFYIAFEDYELLEKPDVEATERIKTEPEKLNEI